MPATTAPWRTSTPSRSERCDLTDLITTDLIIQPSRWRWSLYAPERADEGELSALIASSVNYESLVRYAFEDLGSSVRVLHVKELFTE